MSSKRWVVVVFGVVVTVGLSADQAQAGKVAFGTDERIREIQPTNDPQ
jgi:hypothetical protein